MITFFLVSTTTAMILKYYIFQWRLCSGWGVVFLLAFMATGLYSGNAVAVDQQASTLDASGFLAISGELRSVSAAGQSGGFTYSSHGMLQHYGGFVGTCLLLPDLDTDGDGVPNEIDEDNDGDSLSDQEELRGTPWLPAIVASDPNKLDTDRDGLTDGEESLTGTDPTDAASALYITDIQPNAAADIAVTWTARSGKTYRLVHYSTLSGIVITSLVSSVTVNDPEAMAPWYATSATGIDAGALTGISTSGFYRVILSP